MNTSESSTVTPSRRRLVLLAVLLGSAALAAGIGGYLGYRATTSSPAAVTPLEPPTIESAGVDPAVAAAVEKARGAVREAPESGPAWGRLGMVLAAHRYDPEAALCFAQAERLDPREPRWPYFHGRVLVAQEPGAAIKKLQRAVELCGGEPDAPRLELAELLLEQNRYEEAEQHFRLLLRKDLINARACLGLGRLEYQRGRLQESLDHLVLCGDDARTQKATHLLMAEVYQRLGNKDRASREARLAASLPEDALWPDPFAEEVKELQTGRRAGIARATQLFQQGRFQEVIQLLRQTLRDYPDLHYGWLLLGQAHQRRSEMTDAEQAYQRAIELDADSVEAHFLLGGACYSRDKYRAALACFRRVTEIKPDSGRAHFMIGLCLLMEEDRAGALAAFRLAIRCNPQLGDAHRSLGELLAKNGQTAEACEHLRYAVQLNPADDRAGKLLAELERQGPTPR